MHSIARSSHAFDEVKLKEYLVQTLGDREGIDGNSRLSFVKFSHGQSNPTFMMTNETTGKKYVIRKQPPGKLLKGAHALDREYRIMTALRGHVPVPNTQLYCDDISIIGTTFLMYDYVEGRFFRTAYLSDKLSSSDKRNMKSPIIFHQFAKRYKISIYA